MQKVFLRFVPLATTLALAATAFAQDAAEITVENAPVKQFAYLSAGLAIGLAAFGGSLGQGKAAAAALEGIARNPNASDKLFTPMILGLALIESLVIYALVVAIMLLGK